MDKKEINYWPYAIVGMILTVVILGIWTIKVAVKNPVQESNAYMMKYQDVDENINEILAKQKAFDAQYTIDLSANRLKVGQNRVVVRVLDKSGAPVEGAKVVAIVQRPTTNEYNIDLDTFAYANGAYVSQPFELKGLGRWNIQVKVQVGDKVGFKTWKTFVRGE
ncbi:FixH family protein [Hydrogenimonas sp.]